ncbi:quinone oxidoreductase family protein [Nocardia cyriacigeorgica]|uniref:quinone oxidoreductase family protein n=1 Tax=Nocardia cyriacigeorgica TaxID=135487 RepID=UPI002017797D|nr:zinc-binding dehydrogenase [Nocardia cyriacigeorgica]
MTETGGPEVLVAREVPVPDPGAGEVLIRAEAVPVLYPETLLRSGVFPMAVDLPAVFGFQAAGEVVEIGAGADPSLLGRRVVVETAGAGSYAEFVRAAAHAATPIPEGVSADDAAAAVMSGSVAIALLKSARLTGTETVLVQAGATGVGSYLVQLAGQFGAARVIATAGDAAKRERARELGAAEVLDHRDEHWTDTLRTVLGDATIDVVFDSLGGSSAARLLDAMTPGSGRMLSYGWLSGTPAQVSASDLLPRGLTLIGCAGPAWLAGLAPHRAEILERVHALAPAVETTLPLEDAAKAHELVESRAPLGKIILRPARTGSGRTARRGVDISTTGREFRSACPRPVDGSLRDQRHALADDRLVRQRSSRKKYGSASPRMSITPSSASSSSRRKWSMIGRWS